MKATLFVVFVSLLSFQSIGSRINIKSEQYSQTTSAYNEVQEYFAMHTDKHTIKDFEKYIGRKLTPAEKKVFRQLAHRYNITDEEDAAMLKNRKLGTWSMVLGIAGFVAMFIPGVVAASLLLLPAALITGIIAISNASRFKEPHKAGRSGGIAGVVLGGLGVLIIIAAIIAISTLWNL